MQEATSEPVHLICSVQDKCKRISGGAGHYASAPLICGCAKYRGPFECGEGAAESPSTLNHKYSATEIGAVLLVPPSACLCASAPVGVLERQRD